MLQEDSPTIYYSEKLEITKFSIIGDLINDGIYKQERTPQL